jgi:aspartate-semialdehyde dehydrogenase
MNSKHSNKFPVAILGATGPVGQKAISLLENHPLFEVKELAASEGSVGHIYGERVQWKNEYPLSDSIAKLKLKPLLDIESKYVISALPADIAMTIEPALAERGHIVCSNASAFRMDPRVPLLIPEVNRAHVSLLADQPWTGKILTNPNCSTIFLAGPLGVLRALGEFDHVHVVTMQALSGAGYPGVPSFDLLGNLIPYIGGEEDKIRLETKKILGTATDAMKMGVTVHVHRVPVLHGHTVATHVRFKKPTSVDAVLKLFQEVEATQPNFIKVHMAPDMRIHVGRIKQGDAPDIVGFVALGHNLVRGAAGAAIAILEEYVRGEAHL